MKKVLYVLGSFIIILLIGINAIFYYENMYVKNYIPVSQEVYNTPKSEETFVPSVKKPEPKKEPSIQLQNKPKEYKATISLVGDVFFNGYLLKSYYDRQTQSYSFGNIMENVKDITYADLSIFKFDSSLTESMPVSTYGRYNAPKEVLNLLKSAGFKVAVLSSSHIFDGKKQGLEDTIKNLKDVGISSVGVKLSSGEQASKVFDINNIRIGVAAFTKELSRVYLEDGSSYKEYVNVLDKDIIKNELEYLKGRNCDIIIAYANWGYENSISTTSEQKEFARELIKYGADIVIGTHTHTIQPFEKIQVDDGTSGKRDGIVFYSLGNFLCDQTVIFPYNRFGLTVRLELTKRDDKLTKKILVEPIYIFRKTRTNGNYYDFMLLKAKDILNRTDVRQSYIRYAKKLLEDVKNQLQKLQ
ncbi:CapA family protein [Caldicellulosiruptor naganoensis]|uniref:CapA family protein n=1 Tax=Caldicellulosiruptor naganoensis TaxID=29324 RepID=A0ABY7BD78_9FIRM|nr:CapA family protein [Caldicellulosiruptor naganoensis]WAM30777.1 CapA family protein [Caldicellulosiruptor naganoensis]